MGLYVHVPFCVHKCGYCDFNSWAEEKTGPQLRWFETLKKQVHYWAPKMDHWEFETVFFGGGTPSLLSNDLIRSTMELLRSHFKFSSNAEITWEVNPETLDEEKLATFQESGINRLSMGVQSFRDHHLERLERRARRADNLRALSLIKSYWRGRWSMDLMFGLPGQSLLEWGKELDEALQFKPRHISAYQLTLTTQRSKNWQQPPEEDLLQEFLFTRDKLEMKGLPFYEVSNFAVPGDECRHNLKYWELRPFLGLGPGAAGLLSGKMLKNGEKRWGFHQKIPDNFEGWEKGAGLEEAENGSWLKGRTGREHFEELLMMGLRLRKGIEAGRIEDFLGQSPENYANFLQQKQGLISIKEGQMQILNTHLERLFGILDQFAEGALDFKRLDPKF